jgi:starvation-inducible DNA-binding protein
MEPITLDKGFAAAEKENAKKEQTRAYTRLGYNKMESTELVEKLNLLLANYSVHYQKLRNFHWNVKGPDFFDIHEKFEEQYNDAKVAIDDIAERIRVFGHTPYSTMREFLDHADIKESGTDLRAHEMVSEIIKDYEHLLEYMHATLEVALDVADSGTEDMIKGFVKQIETNHWMMSAFNFSEQ